ncbi:hypothetical protein T4D_8155 [Trichinella pseudospiralis]|uniref:Secreted protein n=1 Tax=Trichinella pseudospiralis TaxID=6337 RepID=A0A0V1FC85_TRIPS|nr:hypothetical protein T4D_8155 [Trichinella pseudospiralis]
MHDIWRRPLVRIPLLVDLLVCALLQSVQINVHCNSSCPKLTAANNIFIPYKEWNIENLKTFSIRSNPRTARSRTRKQKRNLFFIYLNFIFAFLWGAAKQTNGNLTHQNLHARETRLAAMN